MAYTNGASNVGLGTSLNPTHILRKCLSSIKVSQNTISTLGKARAFAQPFKEKRRQENK